MKIQEFINQDRMIIQELPKYIFSVSIMNPEKKFNEHALILSFALVPTELLGGNLSDHEKMKLTSELEIMGQLKITKSVLKDIVKHMG